MNKLIINNAFRDINSEDKYIITCELLEGNIVVGNEIKINSTYSVKILQVDISQLYNEINLTVNDDLFKEFDLNSIRHMQFEVI